MRNGLDVCSALLEPSRTLVAWSIAINTKTRWNQGEQLGSTEKVSRRDAVSQLNSKEQDHVQL